jgi:hypothetical protein
MEAAQSARPPNRSGNDGGSTVHEGSCMFGHLDENKGTGWDIAVGARPV